MTAQKGYTEPVMSQPVGPKRNSKSHRRGANVAEMLARALEDYRCARLTAAGQQAARLIDEEPSFHEATLLLARIQLKRDPSATLETLARTLRGARGSKIVAESSLLQGIAYARLGDPASARAQFARTERLTHPSDPIYGHLLYHRAGALWIERRLVDAKRTLAKLPPNIDLDLDLQAQILRGAIAAAQENLPEQGAILLAAHRRASDSAGIDVHARAILASQLASLAVELPSAALRDAAMSEIAAVPWTPDIADAHFEALRSIAWRHALDGDEFNAFRRLKDAVAVTPSAAWRVAALADRAYLATAFGERRWAAQELRDVHELALTVDWASVDGEEKLALPLLAELFAARDPSVALWYLGLFKNVGKHYARVLSSHRDRRVEALETYSFGKVQAALGETAEATRLLAISYQIYDRLGIAWRAGRAAAALSELDAGAVWSERAQHGFQHYAKSWLVRASPTVAGVAPAPSPELDRLTPAQRGVFDLILQGRSTTEIAQTLGRSNFTVRNHIKAIFKAFGVSSRTALIVRSCHPSK